MGEVEFEDVTVNTTVHVGAKASFKNVNFNEANDYYALWIAGNVTGSVVVDNCTFNTGKGRFIKVADEDVTAPAQINLTVKNSTFTSTENNKPAILVTSTGGAKITAYDNDISGVLADSTNIAWVDKDRASSADKVVVRNENGQIINSLKVENGNAVTHKVVAKINGAEYISLQEAMSAAKTGETIKLVSDIEIGLSDMTSEGNFSGIDYYRYARLSKRVPVNITLDLNEHKISLKEDATNYPADKKACYRIFYINYGSTLNVVGKGNIDINAKDNVSGYVFVTNNQGGSVTLNLNIDGTVYGNPCVVKNYGNNTINVLNGTYGISQLASEGTENNNPRAIFNSQGSGNKSIKIKGGTLIGADPKNMDDGNILASGYEGIQDGDRYTIVAAEKLVEVNGVKYPTLQEAIDAAQNNDTITLIKDITIEMSEVISDRGYRFYTEISNKKITLDLNSKTINWSKQYDTTADGFIVFNLLEGADLTITGNGKIDGTNVSTKTYASLAFLRKNQEAKLTIENGEYLTNTRGIYVYENGGEVTINGGRFECIVGDGKKQLLNVAGYLDFKDKQKIVMNGGTIVNTDPRFVNDGNMVPDGYVVTKTKNAAGKNEYTVIPKDNNIVASVLTATQDYDYQHPGNESKFTNKYGYAFPAKVENYYTSFEEAYAKANAGDTIILKRDIEGDGLVIDKDITIDLNDKKYTVSGKAVGSVGTETNGFQLLANNVTFKNGTLKTAPTVTCKNNEVGEYIEKAGILIQNYANLNLENVILDGTNLRDTGYALSNCKGNVKIENSTIDTTGNTVAFDVDNSRGTNQTVEVIRSEINGRVAISDNTGKSAKLVSGSNEYSEDGFYKQNGTAFEKIVSRAEKVEVSLKPVVSANEDERLYDIYIESKDDGIINRLTSAQLALKLTPVNGDLDFIVSGTSKINVGEENGVYLFNYNGITAKEETNFKIKLGQVKVTGYGTFKLGFDIEKTNKAHTTDNVDNRVKDYVYNVTDVANSTLALPETIEETIAVATRDLKIEVIFPNAVEDNNVAYQGMTVTIKGNGLAEEIELGTGSEDSIAMVDGKYTINETLVKNMPYTVTVSGDGYRTANYTVTMNEDKNLCFWNNVMTDKKAVEYGKPSSEKYTTFLAGEIVKDGKINIYDLSAVVSYFGAEATANEKENGWDFAKYDLNRDGKVDSKDVAYVLASYNN